LYKHQDIYKNYGFQITTDVMYHSCVNCLGLYFRFMNEVMTRRSFLDRRKCVESTLRLNYEKDQEVKYSILINLKLFRDGYIFVYLQNSIGIYWNIIYIYIYKSI
jgi:hypothetical protein